MMVYVLGEKTRADQKREGVMSPRVAQRNGAELAAERWFSSKKERPAGRKKNRATGSAGLVRLIVIGPMLLIHDGRSDVTSPRPETLKWACLSYVDTVRLDADLVLQDS